MKKIRIALIGLGDIAQKAYMPLAASHAKVSPILCTRNTQNLSRLATQYRIDETYSDIDTLIKHKPDAAMVHSSTISHFTLISKLLHAGIPVFVDKPLSYSLSESEILLNLATQKKLLLYVGFNRRFAPLISSLHRQPDPIQIYWHKNRVNLAGNPREFIFDDFIHVVDSLRFLGTGSLENLQVFSKLQNNELASIQVQWEQNGTLLNGTMNRISGITEERVEYYTKGNKWQINELNTGVHFQNEKQIPIIFNNWNSTLYKRGFVDLFEDWINALEKGDFDDSRRQDIWETHLLCETILSKVVTN